ncbi:MAG: ATP-binding protein [Desulfarculaceae bacterium]|nr:ATP-binding protein [Desulfarculaceae bacterium]
MARRPAPGVCLDCGGQTQAQGFYSAFHKAWRWLAAPNLCPACEEARLRRERAGERRAQAAELVGRARLPSDARAWDFGQAWDGSQAFKHGEDLAAWQRAWQACKSWHGGRTGLLLRGPTGTGKTVLVVCTLKAWVADKLDGALYLSAPDWNGDLGAKGPRRTAARELLVRAIEAGLAVVDDLAVDRLRAEAQRGLVRLIDRRQAEGRPTLVVTNASDLELARRFRRVDPHGRLADRLAEYCRPVAVEGLSFRQLKAEAAWR